MRPAQLNGQAVHLSFAEVRCWPAGTWVTYMASDQKASMIMLACWDLGDLHGI